MINLRSLSASPSGRQRSDFMSLPDLDHFLRPAAVPVIAIPLAFRRRRVRRGSDKRSSRSKPDMDISSPRLDFLLGKNRNRAAAGFKIFGNGKWKSQAHIAALYPRNSNQVTVISIDHLPRFTPLL